MDRKGKTKLSQESAQSLKRFELENNVVTSDHLFITDPEEQRKIINEAPWKKDPEYFKSVQISVIALIKLVMHAKSGGDIEVMGSLQGRVKDGQLIILDSFALPVEGTETRVSAQNQGYEYMVKYITDSERVGRKENVVGWYHSHPGYGCWLSGIDVGTQTLNQTYSEPFCAIVVDPHKTISFGKVEIGAFRTYPEVYISNKGYTPAEVKEEEYQSIPLNKIEDFGVHCKSYYSLKVNFFKSSLDQQLLELLWNKYWVNTLSSMNLDQKWLNFGKQIDDLAGKTKLQAEKFSGYHGDKMEFKPDGSHGPLSKIVADSALIQKEASNTLDVLEMKSLLFHK